MPVRGQRLSLAWQQIGAPTFRHFVIRFCTRLSRSSMSLRTNAQSTLFAVLSLPETTTSDQWIHKLTTCCNAIARFGFYSKSSKQHSVCYMSQYSSILMPIIRNPTSPAVYIPYPHFSTSHLSHVHTLQDRKIGSQHTHHHA